MVGGWKKPGFYLLSWYTHPSPPALLLLPGKLLIHRHACANCKTRAPGTHSPFPGGWGGACDPPEPLSTAV